MAEVRAGDGDRSAGGSAGAPGVCAGGESAGPDVGLSLEQRARVDANRRAALARRAALQAQPQARQQPPPPQASAQVQAETIQQPAVARSNTFQQPQQQQQQQQQPAQALPQLITDVQQGPRAIQTQPLPTGGQSMRSTPTGRTPTGSPAGLNGLAAGGSAPQSRAFRPAVTTSRATAHHGYHQQQKGLHSIPLWQEIVSRDRFRLIPAPGAEESVRNAGGLAMLLAPVLAALADRRGVRVCAPPADAFEGSAACRSEDIGEVPPDALHFALRDEETVKGALGAIDAWMYGMPPGTPLPPGPPAQVVSASPPWVRGALLELPTRLASEGEVTSAFARIPPDLRRRLLPFQCDGVRFGLRRHGRCLIADDMGVGKTLQAIAITSAYRHEGSVLVILPASLRLMWAEEIERWVPQLRPGDIHIVFGSEDRLSGLAHKPRVVITSYNMVQRLEAEMLATPWAVAIADESHALRTGSLSHGENKIVASVEKVLRKIPRVVMLSGTPALSRPYDLFVQAEVLWPQLLSNSKAAFANAYCERKLVRNGRYRQGFHYEMRGGQRLPELHALLRECIMIRRRKEEVLAELPPKRRQVVRLVCPEAEGMVTAADEVLMQMERYDPDAEPVWSQEHQLDGDGDGSRLSASQRRFRREGHFWQQLGLKKVNAVGEWLKGILDGSEESHKIVVFAHHHAVMDELQSGPIERCGVGFVRIDGTVPAAERQELVARFRSDPAVRVAILGIKSASTGLDFSSASAVVFAEIPEEAALLQQAEDRAHRRGVKSSVLVHILVARGSAEELRWQRLAQSMDMLQVVRSGETALEKGTMSIRIDAVVDHEEGAGADAARVAQDSVRGDLKLNFEASGDEDKPQARPTAPPTALDGFCSQPLEPPAHLEGTAQVVPPVDGDVSASAAPLDSKGVVLTQMVAVAPPQPDLPSQPAAASGTDAPALWVEVSGHTGRLHLHHAADGSRPMHVNVLPQQALLEEPVAGCVTAQQAAAIQELPAPLCGSSSARAIVRELALEWRMLRAYDRRRLVGRLLQPPLTSELAALDAEEKAAARAAQSARVGGARSGGSRPVRHAGLADTAAEMPAGATVHTVRFTDQAAKVIEAEQPFSDAGTRLCVLCMSGYELPHARRPEAKLSCRAELFCSRACHLREREMACSAGLRNELRKLERGVCVLCKLDCVDLVRRLAAIRAPERGAERVAALARRRDIALRVAPQFAGTSSKKSLERLVASPVEGYAWQADHIVPVFRGGGLCTVANMRTLCTPCHANVTKEQAKQRADERRTARPKGQRRIDDVLKREQQRRREAAVAKGAAPETIDLLSDDGDVVDGGDSDEGGCQDSEGDDEELVLKLIGSDQDDFKDDVRGAAATHARQLRKRARRAR